MAKTCPNCNETFMKVEKYFYKDKSRKDGFHPYCKECAKDMAKYYEEKGKVLKDTRICAYINCNIEFSTRKPNKIYCCTNHNTKAYQLREGKENISFRQSFLKRLHRKKEVNKNATKKWTIAEGVELLELRSERKTFPEIAKILGRSSGACGIKYQSLKKKINQC